VAKNNLQNVNFKIVDQDISLPLNVFFQLKSDVHVFLSDKIRLDFGRERERQIFKVLLNYFFFVKKRKSKVLSHVPLESNYMKGSPFWEMIVRGLFIKHFAVRINKLL
jgi:hypothetical protein